MKNLEGNKRALFLSLSGIGNLIMQLPTIEALKKAHPTWHVTVWVAPRGTKELAESQPYIDEVIEMQASGLPAGLAGRFSAVMQHVKNILTLRKNHFDIGIVLSPGQLLKSAAYLKLAGIPMRIGNTYPYKNSPSSSRFLTHAIDEVENLHDIEQNLRLLEPLGIQPEQVPYYSLKIPQENLEEAKSYNLKATSYIGIHAGCAAGFEFKQWPVERFAEVAKALLHKNPNIQFLIFGGPDEEDQKRALATMINASSLPSPVLGEGEDEGKLVAMPAPHPNPLPIWERGTTGSDLFAHSISASLLTTAAIIHRCNLFISNDSGLMHVAAAVGVPTIGLFGPTDEALTGPRGPKGFIVRAEGTKPVYTTENRISLGASPHTSLLAITPQMVLGKISL